MTTSQPTPLLKDILEKRGKGAVADLASKCNVTRTHMSAVVNNGATPSWTLKVKVAAVLNKEVDDLWATR